MFLPTRAGVEEAARLVGERFPRIHAQFYHGGEPIRVIRPFLEDGAPKPYVLAMTAAGQSALNVKGLDTVVIDDTRFTNVVERGRNVLTRTHLGANEILQMAGRVHGRVEGGQVFILSDRDIEFQDARADGARVPARRRLGARRHDLRGARRPRRRAGPAGPARPHGVSQRARPNSRRAGSWSTGG